MSNDVDVTGLTHLTGDELLILNTLDTLWKTLWKTVWNLRKYTASHAAINELPLASDALGVCVCARGARRTSMSFV